MRMYDIIKKKRDGGNLTKEEIDFFIKGYVSGEIPDYQASALLMAVYFRGMNSEETTNLTLAITASGDTVDLSGIKGVKVDKHSTGGVGDKTTLIVAPIVASCGVKVAKMSGRGLGHTGGTVDKLESIKGYSTTIERDRFFEIVNEVGCSVIGQSGELAPADKKIYALRDVTATVDKRPLIASSIMGKKLASGADGIVLDVKVGSGAFCKSFDEALSLAKTMVNIGNRAGKVTRAVLTNMDKPLGRCVGNSLEVIEAIEVLKGQGDKELIDVCIELAGNMLSLAGFGDLNKTKTMAYDKLRSGAAFERFKGMVKAQGGDTAYLDDTSLFQIGEFTKDVVAKTSGYILKMDAEKYGLASLALGAGRNKKEDKIDFGAGIEVFKKTGDYVNEGDVLCKLYTSVEDKLADAEAIIYDALTFGENKPADVPIILGRVK